MPPPLSIAQRRKFGRALAAVVFSALAAALSFACSDSPAPGVPSVISHSASISEDNPLIAFVSVELSAPGRVAVEYENEYAGKFRTAMSDHAAEHVIPVARLRADTAYEYAVRVEKPDGALAYGARGEFVSGGLAMFATMRSDASGRSSQSLILADYFARFHDNTASRYILMWDELGEIVWMLEDARRGADSRRPALAVRILSNGNLMYPSGGITIAEGLGFFETTPLGELVNKIVIGDKGDDPHHDFITLDDGRILYIGRYNFDFDDSANGGDAETTTRIGSLNIYAPATGSFERVWDDLQLDITDPDRRGEWPPGRMRSHWSHLNSVSQSPDGGYIISSRNRNQVISISSDFQTIRWKLGGTDSDFDFPDPTDRFALQHTAAQLPNGNVLVFDNQADLPEGDGYYSRALELRLDFDAMTAVKAWEFSPDPPMYAPTLSSAYRLDGGGSLINFGRSEDMAAIPIAIIEADAEGREIFRIETIDSRVAEESAVGPFRYRANPGPKSIIGETMLRAPKPKP